MNFYAIVGKYLEGIFKQDPLVNTVMFGTINERDIDKYLVFPLVHIIPGDMTLNENRIELEFEIACVDLRDIRPDSNTDKFWNDNLIDSLNQSAAILVKGLNIIRKKRNAHDIILVSSSSATPVIFEEKNIVDGFSIHLTLSIQNTVKACQ